MARTIDISSFYCANFPLGGGRGGRGSWSDRGGRGSWSDRGGRGSWGGHGRGGRGKSGQGRKGFSANNGGGMDFKKRMSFDIDNRFGKNKLKTLFFAVLVLANEAYTVICLRKGSAVDFEVPSECELKIFSRCCNKTTNVISNVFPSYFVSF